MQMRNRHIYVLVLFMMVLQFKTVHAEEGIPVKLALAPFQVYSADTDIKLGNDLAVMLSEKLSLHPYIYLSEVEEVKSAIETEGSHYNAEQLKKISKLLSANYVLFGSVTKINEYYSMDVQLFNAFPPEEYTKAFAEGADIELLVESLASKIESDILDKAEFIPLSQRMNIKAKENLNVDENFIFAMENEIGDEKKVSKGGEIADRSTVPEGVSSEKQLAIVDEEVAEEIINEKGQVLGSGIANPEDDSLIVVPADKEEKKSKGLGGVAFQSDRPVNINADSLEYDNSANRILFEGNVVARQADIVMFADKMDVLYDDENEIRTITSKGNVKVTQGDRIATGDQIIFDNQEQKIIVTGNPRVWQGDNIIQGKKITVFLNEDRSIVEGGPEGRVNATIYPGKIEP